MIWLILMILGGVLWAVGRNSERGTLPPQAVYLGSTLADDLRKLESLPGTTLLVDPDARRIRVVVDREIRPAANATRPDGKLAEPGRVQIALEGTVDQLSRGAYPPPDVRWAPASNPAHESRSEVHAPEPDETPSQYVDRVVRRMNGRY